MAQKLIKSAFAVSSMTLLSRLLGFVRDVVLATTFGAGPAFDAFVIAFKIPNFMRRLFAEGAFSQAFVPVLTQYRTQRTLEETQAFVNAIAGTLGSALLLVVVLAEISAPFIISVFAPGFVDDATRFELSTHMLRITFPYLLLIALTAFSGATLNAFNRFAVPAFTPVLLNVALITVAWLWAPHLAQPIYALAWGCVIGGVAQLLLQLPFLKQINLLPTPKMRWRDPGVRRVMKLMVPALFGVSVAQIGILVDNFFASFLPAGSISWLYYSDRLIYFPLGVIGVALATVVLPHLSRQHHTASLEQYSATLDWALRCVLVVGLPAAVGLFVLSGPILATLIHHGAFDAHDVVMTEKSLQAFAVGLPAFMLVKILASAFYSRQNIKTPVKIAAIALLANVALNFALIHVLAHAGLALATSLAAMLNASFLLMLLLRRSVYSPQSKWLFLLLRLLVANAVMAAVIIGLSGSLHEWLIWGLWQRILHLFGVIFSGIAVYTGVLWLVGLRLRDFRLKV